MSEEKITVKQLCIDCEHCLINEAVKLCKADCELFNLEKPTDCTLFKVRI